MNSKWNGVTLTLWLLFSEYCQFLIHFHFPFVLKMLCNIMHTIRYTRIWNLKFPMGHKKLNRSGRNYEFSEMLVSSSFLLTRPIENCGTPTKGAAGICFEALNRDWFRCQVVRARWRIIELKCTTELKLQRKKKHVYRNYG